MSDWIPLYPPVRKRCMRMATLYDTGTPVAEIAATFQVCEKTVYRSIAAGRRLNEAMARAERELSWSA